MSIKPKTKWFRRTINLKPIYHGEAEYTENRGLPAVLRVLCGSVARRFSVWFTRSPSVSGKKKKKRAVTGKFADLSSDNVPLVCLNPGWKCVFKNALSEVDDHGEQTASRVYID